MVTSIQLGNIFSQGDKTIVSGGSSGIDTESLINGLVETRRLPAVQLESRIETNALRTTAYTELQDILNRFRDASNFLRNPPGVNKETENIFEYRLASVSSSDGVAGSNYLNVTAEPGATRTNYDITVDQLATRNIKTTNTFALADPDTQAVGGAGPFTAGDLILGAGQVAVELEDGDTLGEVVAKVNASSDQTGVEATLIKVSDGNYRISFSTTDTGTDTNYGGGIPTPPTVIQNDSIFRLDANDINGDGDYANNPGADQAVASPTDVTGGTGINASGGTPNLDVDGTTNGIATFSFAGINGNYVPANTNDINTGGPYSEKAFAVSFTTGADITGTQVIYEQGGTGRSYSIQIAPDAGNGNQPTLFAVAHNTAEWTGADQYKVLNLGVVTANTDYNVVVDFDASANPGAHDAANTMTGFVNGVQIDQVTGTREMNAHTGDIAIGGAQNGLGLSDGSTFGGNGLYFEGEINEVALFNKSLSSAEVSEISTYFDNKYVQPIVADPFAVLNVGLAIEQDAVDAQMTINGTQITRQSNAIDDVIDDLTFELNAVTPTGVDLDVEIEEDAEIVKTAVFNFVDTYNEFRIFAARQTELGDDGTPTADAILSSDSSLRTIISRVSAEISTIVDGITNGDPSRLSDIGITFNDFPGDAETPFVRNVLNIDEAALDSALASDFDAFRKVFEFDFSTDNPDLQVFSRNNNLGVSAVELTIDQTNGVYQATYDDGSGSVTVNLDAEPLSGTAGVVLTGQAGTLLDGLTMIFADAGDDTVTLNLTQGVGDRVFNAIDDLLKEDTGLVDLELQGIDDSTDRLQEEIGRIDEQIERYRDQLIQQYSSLEQAISQANLLLQSLAADADARASA